MRDEVEWALDERRSGGLVKHIVPILLPNDGWKAFPKLHHLHRVDYPPQPSATFFDRLAEQLDAQPRHHRS